MSPKSVLVFGRRASWIERAALRVPQPFAKRWARRTGTAVIVLIPIYALAWFFAGLQAYFFAHYSAAFAFWLSAAWLPLVLASAWLQGVLLIHDAQEMSVMVREFHAYLDVQVQTHLQQMLDELRGGPEAPKEPRIH